MEEGGEGERERDGEREISTLVKIVELSLRTALRTESESILWLSEPKGSM